MRRSRAGAGFREAILETPELADFICDGLQALTQTDRKRVSLADPRTIAGSINLEKALSAKIRTPRFGIME